MPVEEGPGHELAAERFFGSQRTPAGGSGPRRRGRNTWSGIAPKGIEPGEYRADVDDLVIPASSRCRRSV